MSSLPDLGSAARIIQSGGDAEVEELVSSMRAAPDEATELLQGLATARAPVVRGWVPGAVAQTIGRAGTKIVLALARDRDEDVRDIAVEELLDLDPEAARTLAPLYRRKLRSKDYFEPVTGMWALAAIRDREALDQVRAVGAAATNAIRRNTATVVAWILEGRDGEIISRIRGHDHDLMAWLSKGARLIGTPEARQALQDCVDAAFDDECRNYCQEELDRMARRPGTGG